MIINADLHIHSKYSMATSKNMTPSIIARESQKKGLNLIATGDALHSKWLEELENTLVQIKHTGIYQLSNQQYNTHFIATTEVEDSDRIHHLIILPSIDTAYEMRDEFTTKNIDADGRPKIRMKADEIIEIAHKYNCIIGPAHVFTPWTGLFKAYDSITDCYQGKPDFVELGLSADTYLADRISQLHQYTFLTNSDSHSPWPHRIGREFNRIQINELSFNSLKNSIKNNNIIANYGFNPKMGKYHETGCIKCYKQYDIEDALNNHMKCTCGGRIKKGVKSRIDELSNYEIPKHPHNRPDYHYILPLAELLSTIYSKGITTKYVQSRYNNLIATLGDEISILLDVPLEEIYEIDKDLSGIINSYRNNSLKVIAGCGGKYGQVEYY